VAAADCLSDRGDVRGGGAAAAADDVDQALGRELAQVMGGVPRFLVVTAERVGQARVREIGRASCRERVLAMV
jgi:hypothetical protein